MIEDLRSGLLLSRLSEDQLGRVARRATRVKLEGGQMLFRQGDSAERFYLVIAGQIRLFRLSPDGAEKIIEIVAPQQTFAEALMFLSVPAYPVCAAALSPAQLIAIDARDFSLMLRESLDTCFVLLGMLSQRLRGLIGDIDDLTLHSATGRFARYLLMRLPDGGVMLDLGVRKRVLASRLSIKAETFSRVEKGLSDQGVIEVHGSRIEILDPQALQDIAEM